VIDLKAGSVGHPEFVLIAYDDHTSHVVQEPGCPLLTDVSPGCFTTDAKDNESIVKWQARKNPVTNFIGRPFGI
jgi:hypothetical protein